MLLLVIFEGFHFRGWTFSTLPNTSSDNFLEILCHKEISTLKFLNYCRIYLNIVSNRLKAASSQPKKRWNCWVIVSDFINRRQIWFLFLHAPFLFPMKYDEMHIRNINPEVCCTISSSTLVFCDVPRKSYYSSIFFLLGNWFAFR